MEYQKPRDHVVSMCQTMLARGYLKATEGNVSARIPGQEAFAITPSNYDYLVMRPEDVCVVSFDGQTLAGELPASVEASLHAGIYRIRPDVRAIVHTHQQYAYALAVLRQPIPALSDEIARFLGRQVPIIDYAPSGTSLLAKKVAASIRTHYNAYILANHGVLALGSSPERAVMTMALLEKAALAYLITQLSDAKAVAIPGLVKEIAFRKLRADQAKIEIQVNEQLAQVADPSPRPEISNETTPASANQDFDHGSSWPTRSELGYAITNYPDAEIVSTQLRRLIKQPVRPLRRDYMLGVLDYFNHHCKRSKQLSDRAKHRIPGGIQHNLAFNYPFPIAINRAEGAYLYDHDGNRYIDFLQAGGPTILGSNYRPVREKVAEVVAESGPVTGMLSEYELKLAEIVHHYYPSVEMFRSLGSGTESCMAAVRAARAYTGKKWVIKIGGAYHGWSDTLVYGLRVPGSRRMNAKGIPAGALSKTSEVHPHDCAELIRTIKLLQLRGGVAAIIVEPVGPESGTRPLSATFHHELRKVCDHYGALLIFDEVVTGFRLGMGGAQGFFGVSPDLTVFGKAISGGYPMAGAVGGRADIMALFGSGLDGKTGSHIQVGGTLSANPLSCAAGFFAIEEMARTNAPVIAGRAGDRLTAGLQASIKKYGLPFVAYNQGSIVHLETSAVMLLDFRHPITLLRENKPRKHMMEEMGAAFSSQGLITLAGSRMYTSMADSDEIIDEAISRFDQVLSHIEGV